ncbi:MAG: hydrogenase nickel incorporation protein HypA/HybF [Thermosediminibacterales bacterium]|nr:hydrogenase nickel incorporation protein HypA/HybF [Thermosediminibacterales bacterium]MDK2835231.1 hydrogenase nickel incorporation protein HypA/HybF [Thermosediminibacterales bacterium]
MHEKPIIQNILEIVKENARKEGINRVTKLKVKVGENSSIKTDVLRSVFESLSYGTPVQGAQLEIEKVKGRLDLVLESFE